MNTSQIIFNKLNEFYKKFYINKLLKGLLLFIAIGLFYFIITALIEYLLWLNSSLRAILFWIFIFVELYLFAQFIIWPILQLYKIGKGINYKTSAHIIQQYFPNEVGDKLINLIQLNDAATQINSDLLLAAIQQKNNELESIPFLKAISFKSNLKYLPYTLLPILILVLFYFSEKQEKFNHSFNRIANYNQVFEKPAPFSFVLLNKNLNVKEHEDFVLEFKTIGEVIPDVVAIHFFNEKYFAQKIAPGHFRFSFTKVNKNIPFYFQANSYNSSIYNLKLLELPTISNLQLQVTYPKYLGFTNPEVINTGNLIIPEGSIVQWQVEAVNTDQIVLLTTLDSILLSKNNNLFILDKKVLESIDYQLVTNNKSNKFSQQTSYRIDVIKDEFPILEVNLLPDSISQGKKIFHGKASDDHGLSKLRLVYYDAKRPDFVSYYKLPITSKTTTKFIYQFPQGLRLDENTNYSYYFEVVDNDAVNQFKSTKSVVFTHIELNQLQKQDENLSNQIQQINALEKSLNQVKSSDKKSNEVNILLKQNANLDYKDLKKLQDFFNQELENNKKIEDAAKKLAEKLNERSLKQDEEKINELEKRLENLQKEQDKNKKLYEELQKYTDKLNKQELLQKMQQAKKNSAQQKRSLEQLVEQTKRFYVEQKVDQIVQKLQDLAKKQEQLSLDPANDFNKQENLTQEFDALKNDLNELDKENSGLKKPMDLPKMDVDTEDVRQEMNQASEALKKQNKSQAKSKQQQAAKKMQEMAKKMQESQQKSDKEQLQEDAKALRQILKNLLKFSFTQESTMKDFKAKGSQSFHFNRLLKEEQKLKNQFKFIDDSLHTLASRQMVIQDVVNKSVSEIHYNIDQSLHQLVENNISKGISHQQYVMNHANVLADLLSEALNNIQNQMQMQGSGQGKPSPGQGDPQLSDIIQKQKGLEQQFKDGMQKSEGTNDDKDGDKPNGQQQGNLPSNNEKEGQDGGEGESGEILEIYKEQQRLREALEKALGNEPGNTALEKTLADMKKLERNLLRKGFSNELLNQFKNLNHELLKLQDALKEQGDDNKRQGNSNKEIYNSSEHQIPKEVLDYINGTEILQKNSLPLQPKYDNLVKEYFK